MLPYFSNSLKDTENLPFRIPLKKDKKEEQPTSNTFSPLEIPEKSLATEISDMIDTIETRTIALTSLVQSLGSDFGLANEISRLEVDCRRVSEDATATVALLEAKLKEFLEAECVKLIEEFDKAFGSLKSGIVRLPAKILAGKMRHGEVVKIVEEIHFEKNDFFTREPNRFADLMSLSSLHAALCHELLQALVGKDGTRMVTISSSGDDKLRQLMKHDLGHIVKIPTDKMNFLKVNVPDLEEDSSETKVDAEEEKLSPCCTLAIEKTWCFHCDCCFCETCLPIHSEKIQKEVIDMADMVYKTLPSPEPSLPPFFEIIGHQYIADKELFTKQLERSIEYLQGKLAKHWADQVSQMVKQAETVSHQLLVDFRTSVADSLLYASTVVHPLEEFISRMKDELRGQDKHSLASMAKTRDCVRIRRNEVQQLEQCLISKLANFSSHVPCFEVDLIFLADFRQFIYGGASFATVDLAKVSEILRASCPPQQRLSLVTRTFGPDRFGDSLFANSSMSTVILDDRQHIVLLHSKYLLSVIDENANFQYTFKLLGRSGNPFTPSYIAADRMLCLFMSSKRDILRLDLTEYLNQDERAKEVECKPFFHSEFGVCHGLALNSAHDSLVASFGREISIISLYTGLVVSSILHDNASNFLHCLQPLPTGANFIVYSESSADKLWRIGGQSRTTAQRDRHLLKNFEAKIRAADSDCHGNLILALENKTKRIVKLSQDGQTVHAEYSWPVNDLDRPTGHLSIGVLGDRLVFLGDWKSIWLFRLI